MELDALLDGLVELVPPGAAGEAPEDAISIFDLSEPPVLSDEEPEPEQLEGDTVGDDSGVYYPDEINDADDLAALVQASVSEALEAAGSSAGDEAMLASIDEQLRAITTPYFPSLSSSQMLYFEGVLCGRPFSDYAVTYDNNNDYTLYYGYGLNAGDTCDYIRVYRPTGSSGYIVDTGQASLSNTTVGTALVGTMRGDMARFPAVEELKHETFFCIGLCVALGLWLLGRFLFR